MIRVWSGEVDPMTKIICVTTLVLIGAVAWEYARMAFQIIRRRRRA